MPLVPATNEHHNQIRVQHHNNVFAWNVSFNREQPSSTFLSRLRSLVSPHVGYTREVVPTSDTCQ